MGIGALWAGLRVAMWITHVGGKFRHGLLEKSLRKSLAASFLRKECAKNEPHELFWVDFGVAKGGPNEPSLATKV